MAKETRPKDYPKLKGYKPTRFMLETSHYDKKKYSSDARQNPLHFIITTAGNDRHSIAFELHTKAIDIIEGRRVDPTFYPVVYGLKDDEDWEDEAIRF